MFDIDKCDLLTLFTYRYLLDKQNDIVDLKQDIYDLQVFPERLYDSYADEWRSYIKRVIASEQEANCRIRSFTSNQNEQSIDAEYGELKSIVKTAIAINDSDNVAIVENPLRNYVNALLKL